MRLGDVAHLTDRLKTLGFSGTLNTAFVERINLTLRHAACGGVWRPCRPSMNGILVREAEPADLDAITALDHAAFGAEWWYSGTTFFRAMHDPTRFIVAQCRDQPVGYGFGHSHGAQAHITRLAVHPEQQGQGIGTRLLETLITHFRAQGAETITLNTQTDNEDALHLYRRFGFTATGDEVTVFRRLVE